MNANALVGTHDVLFLVLDTLRFDVACEAKIPNLRRLLPGGQWEQRHAPGNFTYASHQAFFAGFAARGDKVDVVVFAAPQLSVIELEQLAALLDGRHVHAATTLIAATSPENKFAADRMGLTARIEDAGGIVAAGVCFYQSYAREMAEANGWQRLLTNSAKLVNIIGGYGYKPTLATMEACVDSAVAGRIV